MTKEEAIHLKRMSTWGTFINALGLAVGLVCFILDQPVIAMAFIIGSIAIYAGFQLYIGQTEARILQQGPDELMIFGASPTGGGDPEGDSGLRVATEGSSHPSYPPAYGGGGDGGGDATFVVDLGEVQFDVKRKS